MALSVGSGNVDGEAEDCACISMRHLSLVSFLFLCSLPQAAGIRRLFYFVVVDHIWNLVWFCTHSFDIALYCVCMDSSQVIHTFTLVGSSFIHLSQFHSSSVSFVITISFVHHSFMSLSLLALIMISPPFSVSFFHLSMMLSYPHLSSSIQVFLHDELLIVFCNAYASS